MEEYPKEAVFAGESRAASTDAGAAISKSREVRLRIKAMIAHGSSMIGLNGMAIISVHLLFFYTHLVLVASTRVGLVMALAQVWDAFTDPLIGYLSDHTSWKWGRAPCSLSTSGFSSNSR